MSRNGNTNLAAVVRNPEVVGAGGWMTGVQTAADGTLIGRCDTAGPHILAPNATAWKRAFVPGETLAVSDFRTDGGVATFAVAICWSNSAVQAVDWGGYVWIKKANTTQFVRTTLTRNTGRNGNSSHRMNGDPLAFDPANENVLWQGDHTGVRFTIDGGTNWTEVSTATLPVPTSNGGGAFRHIILFDRSSTVSGGRTQGLYIFVPGSGWYRSTNAGANWSLIAGSPTSAGGAKVHPTTGLLISTGANTEANGPVNIWNGTSWSVGARLDGNGGAELHTVEFDRSTAGLVYGIQIGGGFATSVNSGAGWGGYIAFAQTVATVDIPWQISDGQPPNGSRSIGGMAQHPVNGRIRFSSGVGCWESRTPPTVATVEGNTLLVHGISRGIENMVTGIIMRSLSGKTAIGMQDKQWMFFGPNELGRTFTDRYGPRRGQILRGIAADYAPEDDDFWVVTFQENNPSPPYEATQHCGFTEDFGKTWTLRPALLSQSGGGNGGGQIVALSKDIWIAGQFYASPVNSTNRAKNALYITRDRGLTWTELVIGNGNAVAAHSNSNAVRISMCKDPYTPGRVFFYNPGDVENPNSADSLACKGLWMIDVNLVSAVAPTVTRLSSTNVWGIGADNYHLKLRHGGQANTFLLAGGDNALGAYRGVVSGTTLTLTELTGTDNLGLGTKFGEVVGISAGKGRNGSTTPTIRVTGNRITEPFSDNGIDFSRYGDWETGDVGVTFTRISQFPANAPPSTVENNNGQLFNDTCSSMHKSGEMTATTGGQGAAHEYERYTRRAG